MTEMRMPYRNYKKHYADCETVWGSYDKVAKSIIVLIPDGRMKKSGVRGERYHYYSFEGVEDGKKVRTTIKAICLENAQKRLLRDYSKNIIWNEVEA